MAKSKSQFQAAIVDKLLNDKSLGETIVDAVDDALTEKAKKIKNKKR